MGTNAILLAALAMLALFACSGPTHPTAHPANLQGSVVDTASQPLGGVRIEVIDGPGAGQVTISGSGAFFLNVTGTPTMRASKDGYQPETGRATPSGNIYAPYQWYVLFQLAPLRPPTDIAGIYRLTLTAAAGCVNIPEEMRTRGYTATLTGAGTAFQALLTDATFFPFYYDSLSSSFPFKIGVAGDTVGFDLGQADYEDIRFVEILTPSSSLYITGFGTGTRQMSSISGILNGLFEYCPGPRDLPSNNCTVTRATCPAGGFTFAPR